VRSNIRVRSLYYRTPIAIKWFDRRALVELAGDNFMVVNPNNVNVSKTETSWDNFSLGKTRPFDDVYYRFGLEFLYDQFRYAFFEPLSTSEEVASYIDYLRSCGFPANHFGIRTKKELVNCVEYWEWVRVNKFIHPVIWVSCPKKEFKKYEDILEGKIRMFQIPPMYFLQSQLKFGRKSSEAIKSHPWSAYGFNPYRGGVDRLARRLFSKRIRLIYDVSGWDKYIPILSDVLAQTYRASSPYLSDDDKIELKWVIENTAMAYMKLTDGTVVCKWYGNPSGSGTTTRDNILAHVVIVAHALSECYFLKYGVYPKVDLLLAQLVQLFGDDSVLGLDDDFDFILNDGYLHNHFTKYGLKLKYLRGGYNAPLENLDFLGFSFKFMDGFWYPKYDVVRLATSFLYNGPEKVDNYREATISKWFTLFVMSYPNEEHFMFRQAYGEIYRKLLSVQDPTPTELAIRSIGVPDEHVLRSHFLGLESDCFGTLFNFFNVMEAGGPKYHDDGQSDSS